MRERAERQMRQAENRLDAITNRRSSGRRISAREEAFLTNLERQATDIHQRARQDLDHLDRMEGRQPQSRYDGRRHTSRYTNDRYNDDRHNDTMDMLNDTVNMLNRVLPHLVGDDDMDAENRRGVFRPGPGRVDRRRISPIRGGRGRTRMDADDDWNDDDDDDMMDIENVRVRPYTRRKPGGGRVRVPGYTRRAPRMDDDWGDMDDDMMDYMDDVENRRRRRLPPRDRYGRFLPRSDMDRYNDATAHGEREIEEIVRRELERHGRHTNTAVAETAAETARRITSDRHPRSDVWPSHLPPVMPRDDDRNVGRTRSDRNDDRSDTSDTNTIGPSSRR